MVLLLHVLENPRLFVPAIFIHQWHELGCFLIYFSPIHLQCIQTFFGVSEQIGGETFPFKKVIYFHRGFPLLWTIHFGVQHIPMFGKTAICNSYLLQDLVFQPDALRPLIPALKKRQCKCLAVFRSFQGGEKGAKSQQIAEIPIWWFRRFWNEYMKCIEMHVWEMSIRNSWDMLWLQI